MEEKQESDRAGVERRPVGRPKIRTQSMKKDMRKINRVDKITLGDSGRLKKRQ